MPRRRLDQIRQAHRHDLTHQQSRILAAHAAGYRDTEIADGLGITQATVRRHIANLLMRICDDHGLPRDRALLTTWLWCHTDSCAAIARTMAESGTFFDHGDHQRRHSG